MLKKFLAALLAGTAVVGAAAQAAVPTIAVGLALALSSSAAMAAIEPIPGVDIIVRKRSGDGTAMIMVGQATSDTSGRFSVMVKEPGQYTLSSACRQTACQKARPPFTFTSTPPLKPNGNGTYDFTVGADGPFVVSGVISIFDRWGNL